MIVFGGCTSSGYKNSKNDIFVLNLDTFEWSKPKISGNFPTPRHGHSMTVIGESRVALFGGAVESLDYHGKTCVNRYNDLHILEIRSNEWNWSVPNTMGSAPIPRVFHSAAMIEGRLWIFGGECDINHSDLTTLELGKIY
jgi:hypothetical protein